MAARAVISAGYRWRLFAVAAVCLAFAGWSAYDGFVAYPRINKIWDDYQAIKQKYPNEDDFLEPWREYKAEHGVTKDPPDHRKSDFSMIAQ